MYIERTIMGKMKAEGVIFTRRRMTTVFNRFASFLTMKVRTGMENLWEKFIIKNINPSVYSCETFSKLYLYNN